MRTVGTWIISSRRTRLSRAGRNGCFVSDLCRHQNDLRCEEKKLRVEPTQLGSRKRNEWQIRECLRYHPPKESRSGTGLVDNRVSISLPRLIISLSWFWYKEDNHVSFRDLLCTTACWNPWMQREALQDKGFLRGNTWTKLREQLAVVSKGSLGLLGLHPLHQTVLGPAWLQCCLLPPGLLPWLLCQKTPWPQHLWSIKHHGYDFKSIFFKSYELLRNSVVKTW